MADEVTVIELQALRGALAVPSMPPLAVQTLSIDGAVSAAFNANTSNISIYTDTACTIEFSQRDGTDPDGTGAGKFPLPAGQYYGFEVRAGTKVIAT